ncbi:MAG: response regulator [Proteobacteria bacterium]|nr:response regulator [Desulfobacula sp.]MBU3954741.1 response regulator [Pseudomonadota bacterium]MBU4129569.1 response regulator [Pseudomonadota bacterium]
MKVILVDDEQKFINMLEKRLAMRQIQADVAFTGDEAIEKVRNTPYDVAVLDIKMPGISGLQLKKELRALNPNLKIIFVTGHGAGLESGEDPAENDIYLSKPLDIDILIAKLNQVAN